MTKEGKSVDIPVTQFYQNGQDPLEGIKQYLESDNPVVLNLLKVLLDDLSQQVDEKIKRLEKCSK